jgi:hypothetical protein
LITRWQIGRKTHPFRHHFEEPLNGDQRITTTETMTTRTNKSVVQKVEPDQIHCEPRGLLARTAREFAGNIQQRKSKEIDYENITPP